MLGVKLKQCVSGVRCQEFVRQTIFVHVDITRDILHSPLVQILFAVLRKTCVHDQRQSSV